MRTLHTWVLEVATRLQKRRDGPDYASGPAKLLPEGDPIIRAREIIAIPHTGEQIRKEIHSPPRPE